MSCGFDSNSSPTTESTIAADYPSSTSSYLKQQQQQQPSSTTTPGENGIGIASAVVGLSGQQQQTRTDVRVKLTAASDDSDMNI